MAAKREVRYNDHNLTASCHTRQMGGDIPVQRVGLFVFTGTGNTALVASHLAQAFRARGLSVDVIHITDVLRGSRDLSVEAYDLVGIGHPIYGFDAPRNVYAFARRLPAVHGKRTFLFKSGADFISLNHTASPRLVRRLRRKGYAVFYDRIFAMPCNWWLRYPDVLSRALCQVLPGKAAHMVDEVLSGKNRRLPANLLWDLAVESLHFWEEWGARLFGRLLYASEDCVGCGHCVDTCPTGNIHQEGERIVFGWDCLWCMRCLYSCPEQALHPRLFRFSTIQDGYNLDEIASVELDGHKGVQGRESEIYRGYYAHFQKYVERIEV